MWRCWKIGKRGRFLPFPIPWSSTSPSSLVSHKDSRSSSSSGVASKRNKPGAGRVAKAFNKCSVCETVFLARGDTVENDVWVCACAKIASLLERDPLGRNLKQEASDVRGWDRIVNQINYLPFRARLATMMEHRLIVAPPVPSIDGTRNRYRWNWR